MERTDTEEPIFDPTQDKLYTTAEAAEIFSVKQETVRDWISSGRLEAIRLRSGQLRITRKQLMAFANHKFVAGDTASD